MISLGKVIATIGIKNLIEEKVISMKDIINILHRHSNYDFGDLSEDYKELQNNNIKNNIDDRVMSVYNIKNHTLWIITEWNRSYTTILLPEEY